MFFDFPGRPVVLAIVCLIPAVLTWWSGRTLRKVLDDPLLPERLGAHRHRNRSVLWIVLVCAFLLGGYEQMMWWLPLTWFGRIAANFPLRRALYEERWHFGAYLSCMARLLFAAAGFRLLLALLPALAASAGRFDWIAAIALSAFLYVWHDRQSESFRWIMRAKPLGDGTLLARVRSVAAKSSAPEPRFRSEEH